MLIVDLFDRQAGRRQVHGLQGGRNRVVTRHKEAAPFERSWTAALSRPVGRNLPAGRAGLKAGVRQQILVPAGPGQVHQQAAGVDRGAGPPLPGRQRETRGSRHAPG